MLCVVDFYTIPKYCSPNLNVVHMVAKTNYQHNLSQIRVSRHASWAFHLEKTHATLNAASPIAVSDGEEWTFRKPTHFRCSSEFNETSSNRIYQVLLFVGSGQCRLGVVEEVYRGAAVRLSKKSGTLPRNTNPRHTRTSKPVSFKIKCISAARLKIVQLDNLDGQLWETSCIHTPYSKVR